MLVMVVVSFVVRYPLPFAGGRWQGGPTSEGLVDGSRVGCREGDVGSKVGTCERQQVDWTRRDPVLSDGASVTPTVLHGQSPRRNRARTNY
jgi:hypothetical protein